ncbi:hypothetical protein ACOMHN_031684 [Nucella lapillus]
MTSSVNLELTVDEWQDERLTWDPKDFNGLSILRIPCEKIWLPDIVLYNRPMMTYERPMMIYERPMMTYERPMMT